MLGRSVLQGTFAPYRRGCRRTSGHPARSIPRAGDTPSLVRVLVLRIGRRSGPAPVRLITGGIPTRSQRSGQIVFSTVPFCQRLCGSQK